MSRNSQSTLHLTNIPVALLPTLVGAVTLSNIYATPLGFTWVRHLTSWFGILILLLYLCKIICHFKVVKTEYENTVTASLYAGFTMLAMLLGAYLFDYIPWLGKGIWLLAIIFHALHILIFTYIHLIKHFNIHHFLPSWFVTYIGILVAAVVGAPMQMPTLCNIIIYYGIIIFIIMFPFMIWRLIKHPTADNFYHTRAIMLAPSSLCLVSYTNIIQNPNPVIMISLYVIAFCCLIFVLLNVRKFFAFKFHPGFAGLTFPMAIGTVASIKMAIYLTNLGFPTLGGIISQISGFQIYLTTAFIAFVLHRFYLLFFPNPTANAS